MKARILESSEEINNAAEVSHPGGISQDGAIATTAPEM